jgi:putative ABC transport system ATP-binding protein
MEHEPPILDLTSVWRARGEGSQKFVLDIERLTVRRGDRLAIVGPSGVGKSTCLDLLGLALAPSGWSRFNGNFAGRPHELGELWRRDDLKGLAALRARNIGYVLQTGGLLPYLRVRDNVTLPLRILGVGEPEAWAHADSLLDRLGVADYARRFPADLSIGQRQRVAIARALAHRPQLVLADEPTASLDQSNAEAVMDLFIELVGGESRAIVLVTHSETYARTHGFTPIACTPVIAEQGSRSRIHHESAAG